MFFLSFKVTDLMFNNHRVIHTLQKMYQKMRQELLFVIEDSGLNRLRDMILHLMKVKYSGELCQDYQMAYWEM